MPYYELLYTIPNKYTEEETALITDKISKLIQAEGGEIAVNEKLGKFKLTYPIKQTHQGNYIVLEFDAPASFIKKIDTDLKLMPEILRHIIVSKKKRSKEEIAKEEALREKILKKKTAAVEKKTQEKTSPPAARGKVSLEELDKKLDKILEGDIM